MMIVFNALNKKAVPLAKFFDRRQLVVLLDYTFYRLDACSFAFSALFTSSVIQV